MNRVYRIFLWLVLVGGIYHLARDLFQILEFNSVFTEIFHRNHAWCTKYCDYVTLPIDILLILLPLVSIKRDKIGWSDVILMLVLCIGLIMQFLK